MCEALASIRLALVRFAAAFEVPATADEAMAVVEQASAIESSAGALKALAAAAAVDGGGFAGGGERSPTDALARSLGIGAGAARDLLSTGRRLAGQPTLSAAARAGELSREQVVVVSDAAAVAPEAESSLIEEALKGTLGSLRELARTEKAARRDPEARRRAIHARRSLRSWVDTEGVWHLRAVGNPEEGAEVMAAIEPGRADRFDRARRAGEREAPEVYAFDALVDLARTAAAQQGAHARSAREVTRREEGDGGGTSGAQAASPSRAPRRRGAAVKLLVRIDYDAWLRGVPADGETCELVGYGPIAVSAVRDLVERGDPFVAAILTRGEELVGVAHLGRRPTARQQSALEWLYPSCAVEHCTSRAHLEADHREDWARTRFTMLDLMDRLCRRHHALKTRENWALVPGAGKRAFVAPIDPRHPRHALERPGVGGARTAEPAA